MSGCTVCGTKKDLSYSCNYCGAIHCKVHRLPENHDCFALVVNKHLGESWFKTNPPTFSDVSDEVIENVAKEIGDTNFKYISRYDELNQREMAKKAVHKLCQNPSRLRKKPYTTYEPDYTVGTSKEPDYESSPDVTIHGGIKRDDEEAEDVDSDRATDSNGIVSRVFSWFR